MLEQVLIKPSEIKSYSDLHKIEDIISKISTDFKNNEISKIEIAKLNRSFGEEFMNNTIQGHSILKPYGYAGDFLIIDKIYTYYKSPIKKYKFWDEYFHLQAAPKAVRNRKSYFKNLIESKIKLNKSINLLNVASGPARDICEVYDENKQIELNTVCVEMDKNAIEYAQELNAAHLDKVTFINKNIFRHTDERQYDLIWSAGLFDYFDDRAFLVALKRFKNWVNEGGEIIVGNFNEECNPSRDYMEIFGEWYLNRRTEQQLIELAIQAGFNPENISIGKEKENVNLFLHIKV